MLNWLTLSRKKILKKLLNGRVCVVGSSHEWLFVIDEYYDFWLLNIFSCKQVQLPNDVFRDFVYLEYERISIEKVVLSASPSYDENFKAAIIYSRNNKLWYCGGGGGTNKWIPLSNEGRYIDMVREGDKLYALGEDQIIVMFDFINNSKPEKQMIFSPSYLEKLKINQYDVVQFYLVVSNVDILVIQRFIGDMVNGEGRIVEESNLFPVDDDGNNHPLVCPYRTLEFMVFKMVLERGSLRKLEFLENDQAIVLGGNQTISLSVKNYPEIKKDSIYFSDNYWDRINEDYLYRGHDCDVFNLETRSVKLFVDSNRFDPTPFWVTIL